MPPRGSMHHFKLDDIQTIIYDYHVGDIVENTIFR